MRFFEQTFQVVSVWNHSVTINRNRLNQTNKKSLKYFLKRQQLRDWQIILRQRLYRHYVGVYFSWEWADKAFFFVNVEITGLNIYFIHLILWNISLIQCIQYRRDQKSEVTQTTQQWHRESWHGQAHFTNT